MRYLKSYDLYSEGLFNWIRAKRFKDDDILQNLIKIVKSNKNDVIVTEPNDEGDLHGLNVRIPSKDIEFYISYDYEIFGRDPYSIIDNYEFIVDGVSIRDVSITNIKRLYKLCDKLYKHPELKEDDDDDLIKNTFRKELKNKLDK